MSAREIISTFRSRVNSRNEWARGRGFPINNWDENLRGGQWIGALVIRVKGEDAIPVCSRTVEQWKEEIDRWDKLTRRQLMEAARLF